MANKPKKKPFLKYITDYFSGDYTYRGAFGQVIDEPFTGAWQRNIYATTDNASKNYAYFSCLTLTANDISIMEPELQKESNPGVWTTERSKEYKQLRELLEYPNEVQNSQDFFMRWVLSLQQFGNTYCFVDWDGDIPVGLYILDPNLVTVLRARDGTVYYKVSADRVIGLYQDAVFTSREIIHHRINTLFDDMCGIPPLWAAAIHAYSSIEQGKTSYEFYKNAARPSALLIAPQDVSQEDLDQLKLNYNEAMSGRTNAGRMLVLSGGVQYQQLTMSAEDQQLIELLKFNAEAICACFHIPPHMVLGTAPTYNNLEALKQDYLQRALQFIITGIEKNLHRGLRLHDLEDELWVNLDTDILLRMDTATRYKVHGQAIKDSIMTINEARAKEGLEPIDGGETVYLQQQYYPASEIANNKLPSNIPAPAPEPEPEAIDNTDENSDNAEEEVAAKFLQMLSEKINA